MDKKTLLITGVSGFIGSKLAKYLHNEYNIIGYDINKLPPGYGKYVHRFIQRDITEELLNHTDIYCVVHLAATAGVRNSRDFFSEYSKNNILGTQKVIEKCIDMWKPKKLLIASSSSVYGNSRKDLEPRSPYAVSKVATEELVKSYNRNKLLKGINTTCMRFYTVYGPGQREDLAIRIFIDEIIKDKPITIYGTGNQTRDFTYIDDLLECINFLIKGKIKTGHHIDIGSNTKYTLNEVVDMIYDILDKEKNIIYTDSHILDVKHTLSNEDWIESVTPIREGLKKQIEWQKGKL